MSYKNGDMVKCEYIQGEFAKGRIISIRGNIAKLEIVITVRRGQDIYKDIIEANINKIKPIRVG